MKCIVYYIGDRYEVMSVEMTSAGEGYFLALLYVVYRSLNISV